MYSRLKDEFEEEGVLPCQVRGDFGGTLVDSDFKDTFGDSGGFVGTSSNSGDFGGFGSNLGDGGVTDDRAELYETRSSSGENLYGTEECLSVGNTPRNECSNPLFKSSASPGVGEDPWLLPANSDNTRMSGSASLGSLVDPWAPKSSSQQHEQRMFPSAWPPGNPSENNAVQPVMTSNQAAATLAPPGGDNFGGALTVSPVQADSDLFVDCSPDFMEPETDCLRPTANVCSASSAGFPVSPSCLDQEPSSASSGTADQSVHSFLDANSKLVNLDDLSLSKQGAVNPFAPGASSLLPGANPFHPVPSSVSMNQLKSQMQGAQTSSQNGACVWTSSRQPCSATSVSRPAANGTNCNPFLI